MNGRARRSEHEAVVVGGGPAGLAAAIALAQVGVPACVLEARAGALDKACGEGLMPDALSTLRSLGVSLDGCGRPFDGIRYIDGTTRAEGRFPHGAGRGVRRTDLHRRLQQRARQLGVTVRENVRVLGLDSLSVKTSSGSIRYRWLIGADGLHSRVRESCGLAAPDPLALSRRRLAVRRHFRVRPWSGKVEVHWQDGIEAYVTPIGRETVGVAMLWRGHGARFERLLDRFPALAGRLANAEPVSESRGSGPLRQPVRGVRAGRVALVGDAAGYVDAITGEGLAIAFHQAVALAEAVAADDLRRYEVRCRAIRRLPDLLTHALLAIEQRPTIRRRFIATLARHPGLFDRLLAVHARQRPWPHVGVRGVLQLTTGLIGRG